MSQENMKLYAVLFVLSVAVAVMAAGLYASMGTKTPALPAVLPAKNEEKTLFVSGSASTSVIPDKALINVGVIIEAKTAKEASDKNAAAMNNVITELKNLGLEDKDIRTSLFSAQPVYNFSKGGAPTIVGYSASNNIQITTTMLDKLSDIVDRSVGAGANQVSGISFMVSEEKQKQLSGDLLVKAVNDASAKAMKLAESLNVKIVGVKTSSVSEGIPPVPIQVPALTEKTAAPIMPGESQVTMTVQVTYIIEE